MNDLDRNIEAEYSIIGAICIDCRTVDKIADKLLPDDFTIAACAEVYESACDAVSRGKTFDPIIAVDVLKRQMGEQEAIKFVRGCMETTPTCATAPQHANLVHRHADTRRLKESARIAISEATDPSEMAASLAGIAQDYLQAMTTKRLKTLADALTIMIDGKEHPERQTRVDTGFPKLDSILKGMWSGNLCIIGARPGVGKSAFAMDIARTVAGRHGRVLIYSYEMESDEIAERYIAEQSAISMDKLIDNELDPNDWQKIALMSERLAKLPITINDNPRTTIADIRGQARLYRDLKLIIVDYLTLIPSDGTGKRYERRDLEVANYTRRLKLLAKELRVPIIALSQLNRENDETEEPTLRSLRDSGGIEQDANKVLFLWKLTEDGTEIGVKVAKNRRGRTGIVAMKFYGQFMRYAEISNWQPPEKPEKKRRYGGE